MNLGMRRRKMASADRMLRGNIAAAEAASRLHLLNTSRQVESKGFRDWLWEVSPSWQWDLIHLQYTRYFLDKVTRGLIKKLMVFMPPRHGKPLAVSSLILLESGARVELGNISVGDRVITRHGRARTVTEVHEQGMMPTLKITADSGRSTIAALSHPFLTTEGWRRADELVPGMVLANVPNPQCGGSDRPLEEFRLAGYFVGDGQTGFTNKGKGQAANVTCFDPIEADDLKVCADRMGFGVAPSRRTAGRYDFTEGIRPWIRECGLAGKTSHQKRVPDWVFLGSVEQVGHFLGAYFACDGSVNAKGKARSDACAEFYSVNRPLLADVQHLLLRLGIQSRLRVKNSTYKGEPYISWRLGITSQTDVARFIARVPMVSVKLERLKAWGVRPIRFEESLCPDAIVSVEPSGSMPCRCLTVDEDHTFTSDDFVVHNSEHGSIRYPAYRLELDPALRCMLVCHSQPLANKFSRDMRKIVSQRLEMNQEKRSAREWETRAGGGLYAVGIGGVGGGLGFGLIVLDDVIKNAKVAQSPAFRESLWDSYRKDIKTRLSPHGAMILTYTRWHLQDLGGMILSSDEAADWVVIRLPALAEPGDPLGRPEGMALWPNQWSRAHLLALLRDDPYGFGALYQQNPSPPSGDIFEAGWFLDPDCYLPAVPRGCRWVRYWDKAGTEGGGGAYTAGVLMAKTQDGLYIVVDVIRGRWKAHERERMIKATAQRDGPNVAVWVEQEPGSGGKESAENTVINLAGYNVRAEPVRGDKTTRALPMAGQASVGNIVLLRDTEGHRWNRAFLDELFKFPQGQWKDQVDAAAGAFNKLALVPAILAAEVSGPSVGIEHSHIGTIAYPDPLGGLGGPRSHGVTWGADPEVWTPGGGLGGIQGHVDASHWAGGVV